MNDLIYEFDTIVICFSLLGSGPNKSNVFQQECFSLKPFPPVTTIQAIIIPPASTKLNGGILVSHPSVRPSVCLSVCGCNCVCSVSSTILAGSISYLYILSSNFQRCVVYEGFNKLLVNQVLFVLNHIWQILEICNFVFFLFWLGIQYESIVWVIMGRRRVFSVRRHSGCSSCQNFSG